MPALRDDTPTGERLNGEDAVRAFTHHGLELAERGKQRNGDCPFCKADKFTVNGDNGLWRCWVCSRTGNALDFLRTLWEASDKATDDGWYKKLADDRKLLDRATLQRWGACRSVVDGTWMLPGYNARKELVQLYRRVQMQGSDGTWSWRLLPTPGVWPEGKAHALHMPSMDHEPEKGEVWVAEGPWDGMALWEVARQSKRVGTSLELTGNPAASILVDANVVAVPGCSVWQDGWTEMCRGKAVTLLYDNDHPRDNNGTVTTAGWDGMRRVAGKLAGVARSVSVVHWGMGGFDASLLDGHDVRDALSGRVK